MKICKVCSGVWKYIYFSFAKKYYQMLMRYGTFQQQGFQTTALLIAKIATQPSKQLHAIYM